MTAPNANVPGEPLDADPREPYVMWTMSCPFGKNGFPVVGNFGSRVRQVVIMDAATFTRLVAENPNLATAQFNLGQYE
jgi:hypothetical protein